MQSSLNNPLEFKALSVYSPLIGTLVAQLTMTKHIITEKVSDLTTIELDAKIPFHANSIGVLLSHAAAVEKQQQVLLFSERPLNQYEQDLFKGSLPGQLNLGLVKNHNINYYLDQWETVRSTTLENLKRVDDDWLFKYPKVDNIISGNFYYNLFHIMEDQMCHYGQIRGMIKILRNLSSRCLN